MFFRKSLKARSTKNAPKWLQYIYIKLTCPPIGGSMLGRTVKPNIKYLMQICILAIECAL